jgi:hypothetical protein
VRLGLAYLAGRSLEALLAGVSPRDLATFALAGRLARGHGARGQPAAGLRAHPRRPAEDDPRRLAAGPRTRFDARAGRPYARSVEARARRGDKAEKGLVPRRAVRPPRACRKPSGPRPRTKRSDLRLSELELQDRGQRPRGAHRGARQGARGQGLQFRPHFWLADEWFCPDGVPGIAIPSTSPTRACGGSSSRRCSRSRAAPASGA